MNKKKSFLSRFKYLKNINKLGLYFVILFNILYIYRKLNIPLSLEAKMLNFPYFAIQEGLHDLINTTGIGGISREIRQMLNNIIIYITATIVYFIIGYLIGKIMNKINIISIYRFFKKVIINFFRICLKLIIQYWITWGIVFGVINIIIFYLFLILASRELREIAENFIFSRNNPIFYLTDQYIYAMILINIICFSIGFIIGILIRIIIFTIVKIIKKIIPDNFLIIKQKYKKRKQECFVCGAIVPEGAKKCLNCDSEFEEEKEGHRLKDFIIKQKSKKFLPLSFAIIFIIFYIMPYISNTLYRIISYLNIIFIIINYPGIIIVKIIHSHFINLYTHPILYFTVGIIIWYLIGKFIDKDIIRNQEAQNDEK